MSELTPEQRKLRRFPIQDGPSVPWGAMAPHESQCRKNHGGQSLEEIAERGGFTSAEAYLCVTGQSLAGQWSWQFFKDEWLKWAENANRAWDFSRAITAAEARMRELGLCGKHPRACWQVIEREDSLGRVFDKETKCSACERERELHDVLDKLPVPPPEWRGLVWANRYPAVEIMSWFDAYRSFVATARRVLAGRGKG